LSTKAKDHDKDLKIGVLDISEKEFFCLPNDYEQREKVKEEEIDHTISTYTAFGLYCNDSLELTNYPLRIEFTMFGSLMPEDNQTLYDTYSNDIY
jgi:hypothetical protein